MSRSTLRPSTRAWSTLAAASAFALAACQSLVAVAPLEEQLAPLDLALSVPIASIEADAEGGDVKAQVAMWLIRSHGLHGARLEPLDAELWRQRALSNRRVQPITQYTPAFNGQPSRVNIINVPMRLVSPSQLERIATCARRLEERGDVAAVCGDNQTAALRQERWQAAQH